MGVDSSPGKASVVKSPEGAYQVAQEGRRVVNEGPPVDYSKPRPPGKCGATSPEEKAAAATSELPRAPNPHA